MHFNWEHYKNEQLKIMYSSKEQNEKYKSLKSFVNESEYRQIHSEPLVPLNIKINVEIEPGRIYLMDTSIVHDGEWESSNSEDVYQFFLSVVPECYDLIRQNIITQ